LLNLFVQVVDAQLINISTVEKWDGKEIINDFTYSGKYSICWMDENMEGEK